MVSTFYIMKVDKKKVNMEDYYSNLLENMPSPASSEDSKRKKCRVCLQDGELPVTSVSNPQDYEEALNVFADIVFENSNATYLCYVCYKFLKTAILFRRVAHQASETLKQSFLRQSPDFFEDFLDFDYSDTFEDTKKNNVKIIPNKKIVKRMPSKKVVKRKDRKRRTTVSRPKKVTCQVCNKVMNESYYLKSHVLLHNPDLREPYVCDMCGKSFKVKNTMVNHRRRHETGHIFKCELCPYTAKYKDYLKRHMPIHTGELKYLCTECPARYVSKGSLSDHIKLKHTEPAFKCDSCHKAYHSSLTLQRHIEAAHLRIKKHECNMCAMAFSYRHDMLKHQRKVHKRALRHRFYNSNLKNNVELI